MFKRRDVLKSAALAVPLAAQAQGAQAQAVNPLVGTWSLVSAATIDANGKSGLWTGRTPPYSGLIMYGSNGIMSVQIASSRTRQPRDAEFEKLPAEQQLAYLQSYYGYYGRYSFDPVASIVTHSVVSSLDPTEIGAELRRKVQLSGDVVTLTTITDRPTHNVLSWRRVNTLP